MLFKTDDEKNRESTKPCPKCDGDGYFGHGGKGAVTRTECNYCGGSGRI